ncbi:hypothetical protein AC478_01960 [miscellaneous Crenarchaeota group-1 archaeon SG8-32-3]|uniref:Uncharacterized protein n=1 Tax=miscellaneous Crenarchaeota group-1 archaeon SG8-32-3 TaxID=1685125 RepID=A0A0M0BTB9_9ARCH|nr:MAG: hypothetical protein AC478_01960 [miscellaneous Crenarchaeota group-1 archaeon SG8-32-3]
MSNQYSTAITLVIAVVFILAGVFVALLTAIGTFADLGFGFLSGFNTYIFGMAIALTLVIIGCLLLFFGLHSN